MLTNALKDPISDQTEIHENIRVVLDAGIENLYEPEMKTQYNRYNFDITEYQNKMEAYRNELYSFTFKNN